MTVKSTKNSKIKLPILYYKGIITRINNQNTVPDRTKFGTVSLNLKKKGLIKLMSVMDIQWSLKLVFLISFFDSILFIFKPVYYRRVTA